MKRTTLAALATITTITIGLATSGTAAAQEAQPVPQSPPPPPGSSAVRAHFSTYRDKGTARIFVHRTDGYAFLCAAPCTADVPANSEMRVTLANNDEEAHTFVVPGDLGPEVEIEVRPASAGPLIGGAIMLGTGGVLALSGLLIVALSDIKYDSYDSTTGSSRTHNTDLKTTGWACVVLGGAVAVSGLIWLVTRSREPRVNDSPTRRRPDVYGRTQTLLGDVAAARPRDPTPVTPAFTPLSYSIAF